MDAGWRQGWACGSDSTGAVSANSGTNHGLPTGQRGGASGGAGSEGTYSRKRGAWLAQAKWLAQLMAWAW